MDFFEEENMSIRKFLKNTGFFIASMNLLPFLNLNKLNVNAENNKTKIGLIKSSDRSEAVDRALDLVPIQDIKGDSVLIKPNFNTADPAPGSTHNDTLKKLIDNLWEAGAEKIIIGERSGPPNTRQVMQDKGIFELAENKGVEVINFDQLDQDELIHFETEHMHWKDGFHIPRILQEVDHIVAAGCLKTHQFGGEFTMALKLAVGIIPAEGTDYMNQLHSSPDMRKKIAEINLAYSPDLYLIDGVEAFVRGGPSTGKRVQSNVTLIGTDPIAIDAVGVAILKELGSTNVIMNNPVFSQEQIARAVEIGIGISSPELIELVSDSSEGRNYKEKIKSILN